MKDYYKILKLTKHATLTEINEVYEFNISQFNNLPFLTNKMINEIKILKEAKYILADEQRRKLYDIKLQNENKYNQDTNQSGFHCIDNTQICDRIFSINFSR
jgi:DnaJ-class molecular chaperone